MTSYTVEEIAIPETADDPDFVAAVHVRNTGLIDIMGELAPTRTPDEMLPGLQDHEYYGQRLFAVRVDGQIVGSALLVWALEQTSNVAGFEITVLREWRNRGIGTTIADHIDAEVRSLGRTISQTGVTHEAHEGDMLPASTGFGELPLADPGVRFLHHRGYALEQVYRVSSLPLPVDEATLQHLETEAQSRAESDYRVHLWTGSTPEHWRADLAYIFERMPLDAPTGNLEVDPEPWSAERVRQHDERRIKAGRLALIAVIEHIPSGKLVAFNGLSITLNQEGRTRPASQGITLVLKEHRGHRLGLLAKVANIRQLQEINPEAPSIVTDNAEENRPMLDVNEAVGFQAVAYEGAWQKHLA